MDVSNINQNATMIS